VQQIMQVVWCEYHSVNATLEKYPCSSESDRRTSNFPIPDFDLRMHLEKPAKPHSFIVLLDSVLTVVYIPSWMTGGQTFLHVMVQPYIPEQCHAGVDSIVEKFIRVPFTATSLDKNLRRLVGGSMIHSST
jgi:hypothetical protein